jgi:hypothetical protein
VQGGQALQFRGGNQPVNGAQDIGTSLTWAICRRNGGVELGEQPIQVILEVLRSGLARLLNSLTCTAW